MRKLQFAVLLLTVIAIGLLHFFTPGDYGLHHAVYRRLSYFPIVLGALWFGLRGGLLFALLASVAFIPHLLLYLGEDPRIYLNELLEVVLYLAVGAVTGFIASREARLRDRYRQLSEELEEAYERLHRESEQLLEIEAQLGASQKLSALGELSASLAHEIKNPLGSIRGTAEILLDEFPAGHPKREFAEILLKEVERLNRTVSEILNYSRGQVANSRPEEPLDEVVARVGRLLTSHLRKKQVTLESAFCPEAAAFPVDGGKMSQVFLNILLNAIDALPRDGRIRLTVTAPAGEMRVAICDNGPGIPPARRQEIFRPFVSGKEHGTGLGLSISRRLVESCGGRIELSEAEGGGACFSVVLPRPEAVAMA
ncbi:MAG: sensor histidine kinase [Desulfobulbaceae bacterium]|nr:sensor histidine kinase [Desulfobulbaceae bacterium]